MREYDEPIQVDPILEITAIEGFEHLWATADGVKRELFVGSLISAEDEITGDVPPSTDEWVLCSYKVGPVRS